MRDVTLDERLKQKAHYDDGRKDAPSFKVGDRVLVRRFTNTRLGYRWSKPLQVQEVTSHGSLYLKDEADSRARLIGPVNIDHVLPVDDIQFRVDFVEDEGSRIASNSRDIPIDGEITSEEQSSSRITEIERFIHAVLLSRSAPMYIVDVQSYIRREFGMTRDDFKSFGGLRGFIQASKNITLDPYDAVIAVTRVFEI
ncbi:hypothetical protein Pmar_PMAR005635 [Perkinsus marinus ATCC 50983]|uniref:Uncharacterized protein n=1 Tax=Perkinsus marinus (strain ATCC 50983 / TXsc) TaxID=423536 RepID=C5L148_PERM5|nr:hypothetical protein Pmar_PMAR005635 [Perkinsus marinus ATCC 50983]EER09546.1 hypothetical protein Pmar_PMAR005635 [Perkinsus marinus ATCC 50983]|eukprot:XP_002777751.1 hypothetical protein Pmar_PMAR005635 [Perkinsus marinus ATCC 50983]